MASHRPLGSGARDGTTFASLEYSSRSRAPYVSSLHSTVPTRRTLASSPTRTAITTPQYGRRSPPSSLSPSTLTPPRRSQFKSSNYIERNPLYSTPTAERHHHSTPTAERYGYPFGRDNLSSTTSSDSGLTSSRALSSYSSSYSSRYSSSPPASSRSTSVSSSNSGTILKVGLRNLGNTCYMNSCLQCLVNTKPLRDYFSNGDFRRDLSRASKLRGALAEAFAKLVSNLSSSSTCTSPDDLKRVIAQWNPTFRGYDQHDSHELLRSLLDGLSEDLNRNNSKPKYKELTDEELADPGTCWNYHLGRANSIIVDLFTGQLENKITCMKCGHESIVFDPFMDLSVPLPKEMRFGRTKQDTLEDCLREFSKKEKIADDYFCSKCKKHRPVEKEMKVERFPKVLVVHLKRFKNSGWRGTKLDTTIEIPSSLNLKCISTANGARKSPDYSLYAVSNHMGGLGGGHYTAHCSNGSAWFEYNDSRVSSSGGPSGSAAYLLFYEQR